MANARVPVPEPLAALCRRRPTREMDWQRRALAFGFLAVALLGCETIRVPGGEPRSSAPEVVARLTATSPDVHVERSGQSLPYTPNMLLRSGDHVRTGPATYATIDFTDENTVYLNFGTSVMLGSIRVFFGEIFNAIVHIGAGSTTYTNDLSAAAEGTMYLMRTDPRGTTVAVVEGRVRCTPTSGVAWHSLTVTANQQITGTVRACSGPSPVDARRAALWVEQAARRLKRPPVLPQPRIN